MSRSRRIAIRVLAGVASLITTIMGLIVALVVFLFTPPGERVLKNVLLSVVNDRIAGTVAIDDLDYFGDAVVLENVALRTTAGEQTFSTERVLVEVELHALLSGVVHVKRLFVSDYAVILRRQDDGEWNLLSALKSTKPKKKQPKKKSKPELVVDELHLANGLVDARAQLREEVRTLRIVGIDVRGEVAYRGGLLRAEIDVDGQATRPFEAPIEIEARARAEDGAQVVQLQAALGDAELAARVRLPSVGEPGGVQLAQVSGSVSTDIPSFTLEEFTYGPIRVAARIEDGELHVDTAHLELPGTTFEGNSDEAGEAFVGTLAIDAPGKTARAIESLLAKELPALSGHGEIDVRFENPIRSASVAIDGRLPKIAIADRKAGNVRIEGSVADITQLREGRLALEAAWVELGQKRFEDIGLELVSRDHQISVDAEVGQPYQAQLQLEGEFSPSYQDLRIEELALSYPDAKWTLADPPASLSLGQGGLTLDDLSLVSDGQRITAELAWTTDEKRAQLDISDLRIDSLPDSLLPPKLAVGGVVNGELRLTGPMEAPSAAVQLQLTQGRIEGIRGLSTQIKASYENDRITGEVTADVFSGSVRATFDVPAKLPPEAGARVKADLDAKRLELAQIWPVAEDYLPKSLAERLRDPSGLLGLSLDVGGQWPDPELSTTIRLRNASVVVDDVGRYRDIDLVVEATQERILLEQLEAQAKTGWLKAEGRAIPLGDKLFGGDMRFSYHLTVAAEQFPIPLDDPMAMSLAVVLDGILSPDRVTSKVSLENVKAFRSPSSARKR